MLEASNTSPGYSKPINFSAFEGILIYWCFFGSRFGALLLLGAAAANPADLAREAVLRDTLTDRIAAPNLVMLEAEGRDFLAVYRRTKTASTRGAVILLPGRAAHPESRQVIRPLASGLPEHGWETLAIQLPVPFGDTHRDWIAVADQATPRIAAALAFLRDRGISNLVLLGHDYGANALVRFLGESGPGSAGVVAGVLVGTPIETVDREQGTLRYLRKLKLPILDVYGARDLPTVRDRAAERALAARDAPNPRYRQTVVPGADHAFTGTTNVLLSRVRTWLNGEVPGQAAKAQR